MTITNSEPSDGMSLDGPGAKRTAQVAFVLVSLALASLWLPCAVLLFGQGQLSLAIVSLLLGLGASTLALGFAYHGPFILRARKKIAGERGPNIFAFAQLAASTAATTSLSGPDPDGVSVWAGVGLVVVGLLGIALTWMIAFIGAINLKMTSPVFGVGLSSAALGWFALVASPLVRVSVVTALVVLIAGVWTLFWSLMNIRRYAQFPVSPPRDEIETTRQLALSRLLAKDLEGAVEIIRQLDEPEIVVQMVLDQARRKEQEENFDAAAELSSCGLILIQEVSAFHDFDNPNFALDFRLTRAVQWAQLGQLAECEEELEAVATLIDEREAEGIRVPFHIHQNWHAVGAFLLEDAGGLEEAVDHLNEGISKAEEVAAEDATQLGKLHTLSDHRARCQYVSGQEEELLVGLDELIDLVRTHHAHPAAIEEQEQQRDFYSTFIRRQSELRGGSGSA